MSIPDKYHRRLQNLIEQAQPQSVEELQALLDSLTGITLDDLPEVADTPADRAFDLVDEAWQSSAAKGKKLAAQALELWPDCIPAYEYLAAQTKSNAQRLEYMEKAVAIGQRLFGGDFLEKHRGHFWGVTETRPYMRCLEELANAKARAGHWSEAIVIWEDMLSLNPGDNQGIRYHLLPALLHQRDLAAYHRYREQYEEGYALMMFDEALAHFIENGDCPEARQALRIAIASNAYVIPVILAPAPPSTLPESFGLGSPEEALIYAGHGWQLWRGVPGAMAWLQQQQPKPKPRKTAPPLLELPPGHLRLLFEYPLGPLSPLRLNRNLSDEELPVSPFFQLMRELLAFVQANQPLPLTQKGNLQRKTVQEFYGLGLVPNKYVDSGTIKILKEEDFFHLHLTRVLGELGGLLRKSKGKLSLTKKGAQLLQEPAQLYLEILEVFIQKYNWSYPERWSYGVSPTGRAGWAMMLYEIIQRGDTETSNKYYAELYAKLFPSLLAAYSASQYETPQKKLESDLEHRFIRRFGMFFGLIDITREIKSQYGLTTEFFIKRTPFAAIAFRLEP